MLQSELTGEISKELEASEKQKYSADVERLAKSISVMEKDMQEFKDNHEERIEKVKSQYTDILGKLRKITHKLMNSEDYRYIYSIPSLYVLFISFIVKFVFCCSDKDVKQFYKSLKDLARERNELMHIIQHREKEHAKLENELR